MNFISLKTLQTSKELLQTFISVVK